MYLSKILYNPNTLLWRIYCANNPTLVGLAGLTAVQWLLSSSLTLMRPSLLFTVTVLFLGILAFLTEDIPFLGILAFLIEDIPIIKFRNLLN